MLSGNDDKELLARARRLDAEGLSEIHDRFYPDVYRYVRYRLEDELVCEDITAEVFMRLLDALHRRRGPDHNLRGWLMGTASNMVNDFLRQAYRRKIENLEESAEDQLVSDDNLDDRWDARWDRSRVRRAVQQLTPEQQHILALRFVDERSLDETASLVGKTVTAVKALQFRALASLRRLLEKEENGVGK